MKRIRPSEITPEYLYLSRRRFIKGVGAWIAGSALLGACGPLEPAGVPRPAARQATPTVSTSGLQASAAATPTAQPTAYETIKTFNNFYEFTLSKTGVARAAEDFKTSPWMVQVGGLVNSPQTFDIDDLRRKFDAQERIYRLRCVEAWSMVIPWLGFSLADLLREVEPTARARYVRFETLYDPEQMPGQRSQAFGWPYVEGLRLDEAMHDLTLLATGIYGQPLLPQNGAPVRLVVPWKYGFKSIKSIVRIEVVEDMPVSFWMAAAPQEYGFYANVNPDVAHPRWSQATERRIGEDDSRETVLFNGYAEEVAHLYAGMDLRENF